MRIPFFSKKNKRVSGAIPIYERRIRDTRRQDEARPQTGRRTREKAHYIKKKGAGPSTKLLSRLQIYFLRHVQVFFYALGQMYKNTFSSLMTVMVIAISLALPTGLHVILKNTQPLVGNLDSITQISLFIKNEIPDQTIQKLRTRLEQHGEIADVLYISRDQGLKDFEEFSGFGGVLNALDENPIPAVLVIHPKHAALNKLDKLQTELRAMPEVDMVQLDMEWLQKMHAIMDIGQRGVTIITTLLALAVLLIVGNTIRLMIQNRRDEIEITKIIGGTDAFIRRPFLYSGVLHGILGGVIAWILIHFIFFLLKGPVHHLALLYQSNFLLMNLSATESLLLIGGSAILGLGGAYLAVSRHIREIEPH